jgi:hypothetical protein
VAPPAPARGPPRIPRPAPTSRLESSQPKRARKDRGPNWVVQEILALIAAKCESFLEDLDTIDGRDLMNPDATKWNRIS